MINKREYIIRLWFDMWLNKKNMGICDIFSDDALYIESFGPEYKGIEKIKMWFDDWNKRGEVLIWDIKQFFHKENQTVVQWYFEDLMNDGKSEKFDGMSLIKWNKDNKICFLKEFGCNVDNYDPYGNGDIPDLRNEEIMWF